MKSTNKVIDILKAFIKANYSFFLAYVLNLSVFSFIYVLGQLPLYFLVFSIELSLFIGGCFFLFKFSRYYKRFRLLERLDKDPIDTLKQLSSNRDSSEDFFHLKIEKLIEEIQQVKKKSQQRNTSQIDYFTLWLHQIKTPISAISLLMQRDNKSKFTHQMEQELLQIENYTHMALNYLKIEQSGSDLDFVQVSLDRVIKETVKKFSILFIYNRIQLDYQETNKSILSDEKWLRVLVEQILSNSLKYTPEGGKIKIYMSPTKEDQLIIEDTGIGIRSEDLPRIFERGYSGFNGRIHEKSTGLGLFLSQEITKRLGHEMSIKSIVGKGTKVIIDLARTSLIKDY
ncbi:sensor histidine kinase [Carnobacterium inhibens]|uniref:histidine kinase n=2 Tax=Carnobacterium inhibens TaxID=147709 RepID=U5SBY0_9LACT|nr:sensor histidine kinase [Carnobacterium inhibens]AGY82740.1 histidine kinase [Carnobacterium inhibens subsp. gilichinskyi]MBC9825542.1 sensor histidine kinase [Carnobacterium inhibens]MCM3513092.1 sensor histidine kinase [Carnobacterium inhibens]